MKADYARLERSLPIPGSVGAFYPQSSLSANVGASVVVGGGIRWRCATGSPSLFLKSYPTSDPDACVGFTMGLRFLLFHGFTSTLAFLDELFV